MIRCILVILGCFVSFSFLPLLTSQFIFYCADPCCSSSSSSSFLLLPPGSCRLLRRASLPFFFFFFFFFFSCSCLPQPFHSRTSPSVVLLVITASFQAIAEALGLAVVKAVVAITAIIAGGRLVNSTFTYEIQAFLDL
ncbi:hypothetical protein I3760_11G131800 [Carya illinoinensis]|nr:hypothetical protein I3760_11G131800 [Carya illinoinensis]KAG2681172.1 hypothetical protein I3760_11G131800 [Carya illinoinensis]